jgi:hypothetical protein
MAIPTSETDSTQKAQGFANLLAAIGKPIDNSELISHILDGLGADYDLLVTSVTTRQDSIPLTDLYGYMLSYEQRLETHKSALELNISTANTTQRQSPSYSRNNRGNNSGYRNFNFSRGRGHGRGRGSSLQYSYGPGQSQRPICQVCHKPGHTAATCWFRFEQGYQAENPALTANLAYAPSASDPHWYHDTGSTVHLTNELSNLNMHAEDYTGTDQIQVGNGQGLHISNSGRGLLPTPHVIFTYSLSFMFLKYRKILFQLINSHVITMSLLNFILIVSMLRTFELVSSSFKARVNSVSIHGHPLLPQLPVLLLPSLVKRFLWISGISGLVILPLLLSTKLFSPKSCPCLHQSLPPFALHVNRARVIVFILAILLLFPINLFNCCFLMYGALPPQPL